MKQIILEIMEKLGDIEEQFEYLDLETAICLYCRKTANEVKQMSNNELDELQTMLENYDGSLLNDEIKDYVDNI